MTTATKTVRSVKRARNLTSLSDHRFYALLIYRLSMAVLATIVVLTLGR